MTPSNSLREPAKTADIENETVVCTSWSMPFDGNKGEVSIGVKHADGRKYYRPATWDEIRKFERELPAWRGKLKPSTGPICEVPFFSSKELDDPDDDLQGGAS